ncbi:transglutaminase family protein [Agitococcus lubricus]|uniref:Transglutaminase-like putative cysteine protease n=1 Tax=Agitococcus lubricus TaxID=1077255 RepID=A0A2T5J3M8_9GAMM|nr:transglutaminase family protein [Agitococcus lubricus]PTQ91202.1 transglutaminase-like putative cysteine protease [Agitococcus lubricus]
MTAARARYHITHETHYRYAAAVSLSQQLVHLQPRFMPYQQCVYQQLIIRPEPSDNTTIHDSFGNPCTLLAFNHPHDELLVTAKLCVDVSRRQYPDFSQSMPWEEVLKTCCYQANRQLAADLFQALPFRFESPFVHLKHSFADYAADCFSPHLPLLLGVKALMEKIFSEFTFDPQATHIGTPLSEVLSKKRGVCQDFAHLMLACLRSMGLPARYVSGYLLTNPPEGQARLIGADASHAWIAVFCPRLGWVDFDPTNNVIPNIEHITVAWGRDFSDVSPLRGVILGGGQHELDVRVTVMPMNQ